MDGNYARTQFFFDGTASSRHTAHVDSAAEEKPLDFVPSDPKFDSKHEAAKMRKTSKRRRLRRLLRRMLRLYRIIQWASQPPKGRRKPWGIPGAVFDLMVLGFFVVLGTLHLL